jgi:hypothetical protein
MRKFLRENGLTLVVAALFLFSLVGQWITGYMEYNEERQQQQGAATIGLVQYLGSGHFVEALFENWESEFLQMGVFVVLTVFFKQKGSAESKSIDVEDAVDADPREPGERGRKDAPWPVRKGGFALKVYENSLGIALFALFFLSFALHAIGGAQDYSEELVARGEQAVNVFQYLTTSRMWFESFQNWQSEFLSIVALVVLSIFLRQRGSPESKPVAVPHYENEPK